jgi:hypothetical protein
MWSQLTCWHFQDRRRAPVAERSDCERLSRPAEGKLKIAYAKKAESAVAGSADIENARHMKSSSCATIGED